MIALVALSYFAGLSPVLLPIIEYGIDFHRIATEECENIDQPVLACDGKCYLSKQITKQVDPEPAKSSEKLTVQKTGVDPHDTNSISSGLLFSISPLLSNLELPLDGIIPGKVDPPPQC